MSPLLSDLSNHIHEISTDTTRIFSIEKLTDNLLQESIPLAYTPRAFVRHPDHPLFYSIESDNGILAPETKNKLLQDPAVVNGDATVLPAEEFGYPKGQGHWASCISVIDPVSSKSVLQKIDLDENEAATSMQLSLSPVRTMKFS